MNLDPPRPDPERPWLLWDGACGFCCWWVEWARRRGAGIHFRVLPYQEAPSPPMTEEIRRTAAGSVQVRFPGGGGQEGGRACLLILDRLGYRGLVSVLGRQPLASLVDWGYRIVARHRGFLGRFLHRDPEACRREPV